MTSDWEESAEAWIDHLASETEATRHHILDAPMQEFVRSCGARNALDLGCGEGRFSRLMMAEGIEVTGLDPAEPLIETARQRDQVSTYVKGMAERLPFGDGSFDLVVSYITLVDIEGYHEAIEETARVLRPGGTFLVANLQPFVTAAPRDWPEDMRRWVMDGDEPLYFAMDDYMTTRAEWVAWRGIRVRNWHRPLSNYMEAMLGAGLTLRAFREPPILDPMPRPANSMRERHGSTSWFGRSLGNPRGSGSEVPSELCHDPNSGRLALVNASSRICDIAPAC